MDPNTVKNYLIGHPWAERLVYYDSVGSTNDAAKSLGAAGSPSGTVVLADRQTAGRGRMGRSFASPPGSGIYLSLLLRTELTGEALRTLTPRAAVCVRRAIGDICGVLPEVKWVNDLLLGERKICGILTELTFAGATPDYAVIGIGVNCNTDPEVFPPELRRVAGSIRMATGAWVDRDRLAAEMIRRLSELERLDWRTEYRAACVTLGRPVILRDGTDREALALDVGPAGELLVEFPGGSRSWLTAGEVTVRSK